MYERNAIVIDRYISILFGYDKRNNIKSNANNYFELVGILEKYQVASEIENNIMAEYEKTANQIRNIQRKQDEYDRKTEKICEKRKELFEKLDEDDITLKKEFEKIELDLENNEISIKENAERFIEEIKEFNEKSEIRNKCGRERRIIENDYQKILDITVENYKNILKEKLKEIKGFIKNEDKEYIKEQMKTNILKNGSKEKVPFDSNVINRAIDTSLYIEEKKGEILLSIYEKTTKLLDEIKNDSVKIEKHKKQVKDSKSKLDFLNVITDYIILFLDNERMNTIGGEFEHQKVMNEACENMQKDLVEIQNMYSLIIKEINGKATKKAYKELYNIEYLNQLKEEEKRFEKDISKLRMVGAVIYPGYWRIEGMEKIYETFKQIITEAYGVDLSEYEPLDITFDVNKKILDSEKDEIEINEKNDSIDEENTIKDDLIEEEKEDNKITLKFDISNEGEKEDDEFHWDEDDENEELNFDNKSEKNDDYYDDDDDDENEIEEESIQINNKEEDDEMDKEIDEILGIFDSDYEEEEKEEENHILQIEEDEEELDDDIFEKDEKDNQSKGKDQKPKRKSLFGRRK